MRKSKLIIFPGRVENKIKQYLKTPPSKAMRKVQDPSESYDIPLLITDCFIGILIVAYYSPYKTG